MKRGDIVILDPSVAWVEYLDGPSHPLTAPVTGISRAMMGAVLRDSEGAVGVVERVPYSDPQEVTVLWLTSHGYQLGLWDTNYLIPTGCYA